MKIQIKNYSWLLNQKIKIFFNSNEFKKKISYFKSSIYTIIIGIIISFIIIGINSANPLLFFSYVFRFAFHPLLKDQTLTYWAIYIVAGLAVIVSLKAGLFNIGVPGQMLLAGSMTIVLGLKNPTISQGLGIILALIISIFSGSILASIAGILKAYFNVHEVVSTIMLNWIIWYIMKWMFMNNSYGMWNSNQNSTIDINIVSENFNLLLNGQNWIIPFIISILLLLIIIFIMNYTVLGFKIKAVGKSKNVSLYAGINVKKYIIISMAISGGISGILGMLYYMTQSEVLQFSTDVLPVIGFDAIAVALVSFMNGLAILPISLLWGIIKTTALQTTQLPDFQMSKQIGQLIFGIIIYMTAISSLFISFRPIFKLRCLLNIYNCLELKQKYIKYYKQIKKYYEQIKNSKKEYKIIIKKLKKFGNKNDIKKCRNELNDKLKLYFGKINNLKTEIIFLKNSKYKKIFEIGKRGIKLKYNLTKFINNNLVIDHFIKAKNEYLLKKQEINFFKNNYYKMIQKEKEKTKQIIFDFFSFPKKKLYIKLDIIQTKYNNFILKQEETVKKIREKYYIILNEIQQKYFNNFKILQKKEYEITKKINKEIKILKRKQRNEIYKFKIKNYFLKKNIKKQLKIINHQIKNNIIVQKKIKIVKQNLRIRLITMKKNFNIKYKIKRKEYKKNIIQWKNELNKKLEYIIKIILEDNKILKLEYYNQKNKYKIVKKGEKI